LDAYVGGSYGFLEKDLALGKNPMSLLVSEI